MKLEIGQIFYGCTYKTRRVSYQHELITGMNILKLKIKRITEKSVILDLGDDDEQIILKKKIGSMIFFTEKEAVEHIIKEIRERLEEKANSKRKQFMDIDHIKAMKRDLKKWEKFVNATDSAVGGKD